MLELLMVLVLVGLGVTISNHRRLSDQVRRQGDAIAAIERRLLADGAAGEAPAAEAASSPEASPVSGPSAAAAPPSEGTPKDAKPGGDAAAEGPPGGVVPPAPVPTQPSGPYGGVERALGTKWAVWLGGIALALGGIFLVRYTIEAGLLGPGVRIVLGGLLAAVLAAAGEWSRRRELNLGIAIPSAHIPGVLTAAATVVAFGTVYAAHALYGFLGPASAFVLLGATGLLAMLAALLHGPALAGIGLAASYITPALITTSSPSLWPLVLFLAVVAAAAMLLARARRWLWLAAVAVAGAIVWGVLMLLMVPAADTDTPLAAHALLQLLLVSILLGIEPHLGTTDSEARLDGVAAASLAALTLLAVAVLASLSATSAVWVPLAVTAMIILSATAWRSAPAATAAMLAGLVAVAVVLLWPGIDALPGTSRLWPDLQPLLRLPATLSTYLVFDVLAALGIASAAALRLWRGPALDQQPAALYAAAATLTPLLVLVFVYLRVTQFDASLPFCGVALAIAAVFAGLTDRFERAEQLATGSGQRLATAAFAAAAIAALSFGLIAVLERGYLTVALALAALGTATAATARDIPLLRYAVAALGGVVLLRMAWDPRIMGDTVGTLPIVNWLLAGYGVPALAFVQASRLLRPRGEDIAVRLCDGLAVLFTALLAFFEVRHLMNAGDPFAPTQHHVELGLHVIVALGLSLVLSKLDLRRSNPVFYVASLILGGIAVLVSVLGLAVFANPVLSGDLVGGQAFIGSLLPGYLLPGLMALMVARLSRGLRSGWYTTTATVLGLVLIVFYTTLSVRQAFQGPDISIWQSTSQPEHWAHSVAWLVLGVAMLGYGLWRGAIEARLASGLLVALAAIKVAVFDLSDVGGLWRALSFLCLGAVLIGIGVVYQKLIFGSASAPAVSGPDPPAPA